MDFAAMIQNAQAQEQQIINELERLERMRWALRGQIDLLQQLIAQQQIPAQDTTTPAPVEG